MMRIGMVAGESSGDQLGAALIKALRASALAIEVQGIAGEEMRAAGCKALDSSENLSIIGIVEVVRRYPELRALRERIIEHFLNERPDVFIGVDAPEFNLEVEERLRAAGIKTVHYVSPTVWAWRRGRMRKIARAVDLMLTVFPFEAAYYREQGVPVEFVGHPKADEIPLQVDRQAARAELGLPEDRPIVALLPGSRKSEWRYLMAPFLRTALWCQARRPELIFGAPLIGERGQRWFESTRARVAPNLNVYCFDGRSTQLMAAADVVLTASGTASLEAMLLKRPMVVAYRLAWLNYWVLRRLVDVDFYALPNLLAGEGLVPEFIQTGVNAADLGAAVLSWLDDRERVQWLQERFDGLHRTLQKNASAHAAQAITRLVQGAG
jgi:lipid-A-disaccharide synthase